MRNLDFRIFRRKGGPIPMGPDPPTSTDSGIVPMLVNGGVSAEFVGVPGGEEEFAE
jgi:hypothetical protein